MISHSRGRVIIPRLPDPPVIPVVVKRRLPHDSTAFTEGLVIAPDGRTYYESRGLYGQSGVHEVDLVSGQIKQRYKLAANYFGEGLALYRSQLYQLTWHERRVFGYNPSNIAGGPIGQALWNKDGWGLTANSEHLIASDGSDKLYFIDPVGFRLVRTLSIRTRVGGYLRPLRQLNSLAWVSMPNGDFIYANVWLTPRIAVINPLTGLVVRYIDLTALYPPNASPDAVANGVAFDAPRGQLYVTGKLWSSLYEINL